MNEEEIGEKTGFFLPKNNTPSTEIQQKVNETQQRNFDYFLETQPSKELSQSDQEFVTQYIDSVNEWAEDFLGIDISSRDLTKNAGRRDLSRFRVINPVRMSERYAIEAGHEARSGIVLVAESQDELDTKNKLAHEIIHFLSDNEWDQNGNISLSSGFNRYDPDQNRYRHSLLNEGFTELITIENLEYKRIKDEERGLGKLDKNNTSYAPIVTLINEAINKIPDNLEARAKIWPDERAKILQTYGNFYDPDSTRRMLYRAYLTGDVKKLDILDIAFGDGFINELDYLESTMKDPNSFYEVYNHLVNSIGLSPTTISENTVKLNNNKPPREVLDNLLSHKAA